MHMRKERSLLGAFDGLPLRPYCTARLRRSSEWYKISGASISSQLHVFRARPIMRSEFQRAMLRLNVK